MPFPFSQNNFVWQVRESRKAHYAMLDLPLCQHHRQHHRQRNQVAIWPEVTCGGGAPLSVRIHGVLCLGLPLLRPSPSSPPAPHIPATPDPPGLCAFLGGPGPFRCVTFLLLRVLKKLSFWGSSIMFFLVGFNFFSEARPFPPSPSLDPHPFPRPLPATSVNSPLFLGGCPANVGRVPVSIFSSFQNSAGDHH